MRIVRLLLPLACLGMYLVVCAGMALPAGAQTTVPNEWTWQGGNPATTCSSQTCNDSPVYGTLGVASPATDPGSFSNGASWTDENGNFWLFGGGSNTLWEFSPATKEWAFMAPVDYFTCTYYCLGGTYGTLGTPAVGNLPGARQESMTWADSKGNRWLFGGLGYDHNETFGELNDLWKFIPSTGAWGWISGSALVPCQSCAVPGVYGSVGVAAATNVPSGRLGAATWTDASGNLWLFSGQGNNVPDDVWEFNPSTSEWTWMAGSNSSPAFGFVPAVPGALGTPAPGSTPGSRVSAATWVDKSNHFWLFGGSGTLVGAPGSPYAGQTFTVGAMPNDLWEFDPSTLEWTWMGGSNVGVGPQGDGNPPGVYGTLGVPAAGNIPGGRVSPLTWTVNAGNLWLFGGLGPDSTDTSGQLNDLWEFNPSTLEWTWMGGSTTLTCDYSSGSPVCAQPGVYGTMGAAAPGNIPPGRKDAQGWTDLNGNFWIFGGLTDEMLTTTAQYLDDLWEYSPSTGSLPPAITPVFSLPSGDYQSSQTLTIVNGMTNASIYYTTDGSTPTSSSTLYSSPITVASTETVQAIAIATGYPTSGLAAATYNFKTESPTFSEPAGTYNSAITLAISDVISNATVYYTTDGSTPTSSSTQYSMPLTISASETVKAIAVLNGYSSDVVSATYTIGVLPAAATPTFSVAGGTYTSSQSVTISDATAGATIYYTTDGTTPTTSSNSWTESFTVTVSSTETIKAIAEAPGYTESAVASATYTINLPASFSVAASPGSMSVSAGGSGTTTVTVTPANGFNAAVSFSCSGLPAGATCSFSPATVTPPGTTSTTLTVATSSSTAEVRRGSGALLPGAAMAVAVCCFGLRKRRRLLMLVVIVGLGGLGLLSGCGSGGSGGGGGGGGTQPVTSTVTVTGTSGTLQQTATFTLTVN